MKDSCSLDLDDLTICYSKAFPKSFAVALGHNYVRITLDWFLSVEGNFLFHVVEPKSGMVIGFCGGLINDGIKRRGSSSEMIQYAFNEGLKGILMKPWLLFHHQMVGKYRLAFKNLKKRIIGTKIALPYKQGEVVPFTGLVVIGVHDQFQNKGLSKILLAEFEKRSKNLGMNKMKLTVNKNNLQAIHAYKKNGWKIDEERSTSFSMIKLI